MLPRNARIGTGSPWSSERSAPLDAPVTIIFLPSVNSMIKPLLNRGTKWKNEFEQRVIKNEEKKNHFHFTKTSFFSERSDNILKIIKHNIR